MVDDPGARANWVKVINDASASAPDREGILGGAYLMPGVDDWSLDMSAAQRCQAHELGYTSRTWNNNLLVRAAHIILHITVLLTTLCHRRLRGT